ncbi:hypothetical protein EMIHUDRAFT_223237 [Emiliania huxleyi CCMP1516]|uniref:MORN repeat-containing protein 5 n=2 Tax=Emiliania huxleyi TaxID=2903 RepID=A0A0D3KW75_EMIH1|nr:hypothetical protein EMIHUDRAFT_223237 [Emiliania huxleyi CCMP1516]EOD40010.1 hypothetical protein EMIHUDRAFT_223237 [Emiliania huxleyi CCMP1516]|eukprot:XP_005792439.1 hypothetical protein EMIHUDRAFT_223237 [Emiliania huxleyi CCMP1516]
MPLPSKRRCGAVRPAPTRRTCRQQRRKDETQVVYDGEWMYNKEHGEGTFYQPDGGYYTGSFFEGKRHGQGQYTSPAGDVMFKGEWLDNKPVTSTSQLRQPKQSSMSDVTSNQPGKRLSFTREQSPSTEMLPPPSTPRGQAAPAATKGHRHRHRHRLWAQSG